VFLTNGPVANRGVWASETKGSLNFNVGWLGWYGSLNSEDTCETKGRSNKGSNPGWIGSYGVWIPRTRARQREGVTKEQQCRNRPWAFGIIRISLYI
jgi:hypothetical protein